MHGCMQDPNMTTMRPHNKKDQRAHGLQNAPRIVADSAHIANTRWKTIRAQMRKSRQTASCNKATLHQSLSPQSHVHAIDKPTSMRHATSINETQSKPATQRSADDHCILVLAIAIAERPRQLKTLAETHLFPNDNYAATAEICAHRKT